MSCIRLEKVSFGYADILFNNVSFAISENDRVGLVGDNGIGKSTLLKCITGAVLPHGGRVTHAKRLRFGLLQQDIPKDIHEQSLIDFISEVIPEHEKHSLFWKVESTLDIFKASNTLRQKLIKELSGGWQRLAMIARLYLSDPDVLILDEPTNHLDVQKIEVLEEWLNQQVWDKPLLCVSHDRSFLDGCTNKTLFLRDKEVVGFDYSYTRARELLNDNDQAAFTQREKETKEMNRLKRSAHELRQVGVNCYSDAALKKSIQIAKRAEKMETALTKIYVDEKRAIKLDNSEIRSKKVLGLENTNIYSPDGTFLFHVEKLEIKAGERLIISGENGSGKSQLLAFIARMIANSQTTIEDNIFVAPSIKLGLIDQSLSHLPFNESVSDFIAGAVVLDRHKRTSVLIHAGFPVAMHDNKLATLSHGQRVRLAFLMLHLTKPNFYVMDEPTNHLDISGQEQLEAEILEQDSASIIVSHDRAFIQQVGTTFYEIRNQKLCPKII